MAVIQPIQPEVRARRKRRSRGLNRDYQPPEPPARWPAGPSPTIRRYAIKLGASKELENFGKTFVPIRTRGEGTRELICRAAANLFVIRRRLAWAVAGIWITATSL